MSDQFNKSKSFVNRKGWKALKSQYENGFQQKFNLLRPTMHRNELLGSVIELFMSALVGVGKINFENRSSEDGDSKSENP